MYCQANTDRRETSWLTCLSLFSTATRTSWACSRLAPLLSRRWTCSRPTRSTTASMSSTSRTTSCGKGKGRKPLLFFFGKTLSCLQQLVLFSLGRKTFSCLQRLICFGTFKKVRVVYNKGIYFKVVYNICFLLTSIKLWVVYNN